MPIDVLIRGARVVDGTGNPWFYGDVALTGDRIVAIAPAGQLPDEGVREVVDASGLVVCPGFIDIQSHSIIPLLVDGRCLSKLTQGVTTEIMGELWTPAPFGGRRESPIPEGFESYPIAEWQERARGWRRFGDWLSALVDRGVSPNVGSFLGGGTLRSFVKGMDPEPANADERAMLRRVTADAMDDGAFGVSYALIYPPESFVQTDEIVEVCRVVARHGGRYISHIRDEGARLFEALDEIFAIGRRANLPVEIYHLKAIGRKNWDKMSEAITRIEAARRAGIDVAANMYPYTASGTGLNAVLPNWAFENGRLYENLAQASVRERIRHELTTEPRPERADPEIIMPIGFNRPEHQQYVGKRLTEIAAARGQDWVDTLCDLVLSERQRISTIYFLVSEENLGPQLRQPWIKVSTDAGGVDPAWAKPHGPVHPRAYGTYPRVLGKYVREEGVIPLEDAIRKMSSAVADRLGLRQRGQLRTGFFADVVVFDPATVADRATFDDPHQLSVGVRDVWVNGTRVLAGGTHTGALPGRAVRNNE